MPKKLSVGLDADRRFRSERVHSSATIVADLSNKPEAVLANAEKVRISNASLISLLSCDIMSFTTVVGHVQQKVSRAPFWRKEWAIHSLNRQAIHPCHRDDAIELIPGEPQSAQTRGVYHDRKHMPEMRDATRLSLETATLRPALHAMRVDV